MAKHATPVPEDIIKESVDLESTKTPSIEKSHVHELYDQISEHWSHTRYKAWPKVVDFLTSLKKDAMLADVGCGNGKYFAPALNTGAGYVVGLDLSVPLLELAVEKMVKFDGEDKPWMDRNRTGKRTIDGKEKETAEISTESNIKKKSKRYDASSGDIVRIPLRDSCIDGAICIAVLHHLSTPSRRRKAVSEIRRILVPGGRALMYAWAMEQEDSSRRKFPSQDCYVPWNFRKHGKSYQGTNGEYTLQRYCHVYVKNELEGLVESVTGFEVEKSYFDKGNWCVIAKAI